METPQFIEIYTESTPNPKMLKFVTTQVLLPQMILECKTKEEASESPLAQMLFGFDFVESVFISNNFVTIAKKEVEEEWFELSFDIKEALKQFLKAATPIVTDAFLAKEKANKEVKSTGNEDDDKIIEL
jgi:hypothetical protein